METPAHRDLKRLGAAWLRRRGCQAVAQEVRCPINRFRVDVAGYRDTAPREAGARGRRRCPAATVVIECKQSRADFLRDGAEPEPLLAERRRWEGIARHIEERRIKAEEPHLRRGESALFEGLEEWDFSESRLRSYRQVLGRLRGVEVRLHGHTKFSTISRYRLADELYLAAPAGLIRKGELPAGWGLLEWDGDGLDVSVEAPLRGARGEHRARLLRNIAVSASFAAGL